MAAQKLSRGCTQMHTDKKPSIEVFYLRLSAFISG
jgi:hypothetical protein